MIARLFRPVMCITFFALTLLCLGCGGGWDPGYLVDGREGSVLSMANSRFALELSKLLEQPEPEVRISTSSDQTTDTNWNSTLRADLADLEEALTSRTGSVGAPADVAQILSSYGRMRSAMKLSSDGNASDPNFARKLKNYLGQCVMPCIPEYSYENKLPVVTAVFDMTSETELLGKLPAEFAMYTKAAAAYRTNDTTSAMSTLSELLALPGDQRQYRTVWATYMMGKCYLLANEAQAIPWFEKTRELAQQGFRDSIELAADSLGWQARAELRTGDTANAIRHYYQQAQAGSNRHLEFLSLRYAAEEALQRSAHYREFAKDPVIRKVISAYVFSCDDCQRQDWTAVLAGEDLALEPIEIDYLAGIEYSAGRYDAAQKWLSKAATHGPAGQWVLSKLQLRNGRVDKAVETLRQLLDAFPTDEMWDGDYELSSPRETIHAELGTLLLGRGEYTRALQLFLQTGHRDDAGYIAEQVLTTAELARYLNDLKDDNDAPEATTTNRRYWDKNPRRFLESILGRKLCRQGKFDEAQKWLTEEERSYIAPYLEALKIARDSKLSARQRAEAYYVAGRILRRKGLEMLGTECDPDWGGTGGSYGGKIVAESRRAPAYEYRPSDGNETTAPLQGTLGRVLKASRDEIRRALASAPKPNKRFHYRHLASDLMWQAAKLLPDNDELTVAALYYGGVFVKDKDSTAADKFYEALIARCDKTPTGIESFQKKWFTEKDPPAPELKQVALPAFVNN